MDELAKGDEQKGIEERPRIWVLVKGIVRSHEDLSLTSR